MMARFGMPANLKKRGKRGENEDLQRDEVEEAGRGRPSPREGAGKPRKEFSVCPASRGGITEEGKGKYLEGRSRLHSAAGGLQRGSLLMLMTPGRRSQVGGHDVDDDLVLAVRLGHRDGLGRRRGGGEGVWTHLETTTTIIF